MTSNFSYKKYSLEQLDNWMHDAMSSAEATPQEIYDVIKGVVEENYYHYKHHTGLAYELLALLNGNGQSYENVIKEKEYYEPTQAPLQCDKDDPSPECQGAWNSFWDSYQGSSVSSVQYTEEELNAMCDKAELDTQVEEIRKAGGYEWTPNVKNEEKSLSYDEAVAAGWTMTDDGFWIKESPEVKKDVVTRWIIPVQEVEDADTGKQELFVAFPDDLLEAADLKEGDAIHWIDNNDGSFTIRKPTQPLGMDEC